MDIHDFLDVSLQLSIQEWISTLISKQGNPCKDILQWISVNDKNPWIDINVFMDISLHLFLLLWISIWICIDFYGYPCIDLLWILDLGKAFRSWWVIGTSTSQLVNFLKKYFAVGVFFSDKHFYIRRVCNWRDRSLRARNRFFVKAYNLYKNVEFLYYFSLIDFWVFYLWPLMGWIGHFQGEHPDTLRATPKKANHATLVVQYQDLST